MRSTVPFRLSAAVAAVALAASTVVWSPANALGDPGPGRRPTQSEPGAGRDPDRSHEHTKPADREAPDAASASAAAKRLKARVEVAAARTESATLYANPNGSFTLESSLRPIRAKKDGQWVDADATLVRNADGSVSPKAALVPMTFSGGGATALASIGSDGRKVSLGWKGRLPTPVLHGSTATYPNVLAGVDLQIVADVDGFTHVLVVKSRQAAVNPALERIAFTMSAPGLKAKANGKGVTTVTDGSGSVVLRGTAMMWDSRTTARRPAARSNPQLGPQSGPQAGARSSAEQVEQIEPRQAPVGVEVSGATLAVKPDLKLLRGKDTAYPVMVDPFWQVAPAGLNHWSTVSTNAGNPMYNVGLASPSNAYAGEVKVGKAPGENFVARTFFEFNTSGIKYTNVSSATFSINQLWSSSWCGDSTTRATQLWGTYGTDPSTTWNTWWNADFSGWISALGVNNSLKFYNSGSCPAGNVDFDATGFVQRAAREGWDATTLGLKAVNESDTSSWKRYQRDTAQLSITYNSYPNAPDQMSVDGQGCNTGAKLWTRTRTPELRARVTDPDGGQPLTGRLYWAASGAPVSDGQKIERSSLGNPGFAQGTTASLADGDYYFQAYNNDEIDNSQWSAPCAFSVDATAPPKPTGATSTLYPDRNPHGSPGQPDIFTFQPPAVRTDFDHFCYTVSDTLDPTSCTAVAADANGVATTLVYPVKAGINSLRVWSVDKAGNLSRGGGGSDPDYLLYEFGVGPGAPPAAYFALNEGTGTTAADASTVHPDTATFAGSAGWTTGRGGRAFALNLNGSTAFAATPGSLNGRNAANTANAPVRSDQSYTASAWVKLTTKGANRVAVSQDGTHTAAYSLGYATACDCWRFTVNQTDVAAPGSSSASATGNAPLNTWTHLLGVYDATANTVKLYVNGNLAGSATVPAALWNATGATTIGRSKAADANTGFWAGQIDDVRVWNRSLGTGEVKALYYPVAPIVSTASPDVTVGTAFTVTLSSGGDTNVKKFKYYTNISNVQTVNANADGSPVTVSVTLTDPDVLYVGAFAYYDDGTAAGAQSDAGRWDLRVHRPTSVTGQVIDGDTLAPVSGATVTLQPGGQTTTTDATGHYAIGGLVPGSFTIAVVAGATRCALFASTELELGEGQATVDLAVSPQGDSYGYSCTVAAAPFVTGTTALSMPDAYTVVDMPLPFAFNYYGTDVDTMWVANNGVASFKSMSFDAQYYPTTIPAGVRPNGVLAPMWLDLGHDAATGVRTAVVGAAGDRKFIVEWHDVYRYWDGAKTRFSFELIIGEDQSIAFNYQNLPADGYARSEAVVGIESLGGMVGVQYQAFQPLIANGQQITFHPPVIANPVGSWTLSGTITRGDGTPSPYMSAWLDTTGGMAWADENGHYEFTGLEAGRYHLSAYNDKRCGEISIGDVVVDGDTTLDLVTHPQIDPGGYSCEYENWSDWPLVHVDTTVLPLTGDDKYTSATLPFSFPFYGTNYSTAWVDTNGFVSFTNPGQSYYQHVPIPNEGGPNNLIAALWSDLNVDSSASVRTGVVGTAPNRQFVVEWRNVTVLGDTRRISFEMLLGEHGSIQFNYEGMQTGDQGGDSATIGIENATGTGGFQYTYNEFAVFNNSLVTFHPPGTEDWTLSGTVRKADGTPAVGYTVNTGMWTDFTTVTDASGHYDLTGLVTGNHMIYVVGEPRCGEVAQSAVHLEVNGVRDFVTSRKQDGDGYYCTIAPGTAYVTATTPLAVNTETVSDLTLPFAFPFYGSSYTAGWVDKYGSIYFTRPEEDGWFNLCVEPPYAMPNLVAPFGAPLSDDVPTAVYTKVIGTAPHRQLVVEWRDAAMFFEDPGPHFGFEVLLSEDGTITFNYDGVYDSLLYSGWGEGIAGIENPAGDGGLAVSNHEMTLKDNEAVIIHRAT